jgi:hypothetical protein
VVFFNGASVVTADAVQNGGRLLLPEKGLHGTSQTGRRHVCVLAVAVEAPTHGERRDLFDTLHRFDRSVALPARDAR